MRNISNNKNCAFVLPLFSRMCRLIAEFCMRKSTKFNLTSGKFDIYLTDMVKNYNSIDVVPKSRIYSQHNGCKTVLILHFKHFDVSVSKFPKFGEVNI